MSNNLTPDALRQLHKKICQEVLDMGFTLTQLCAEAGYKTNNLSKIKSPSINTIVRLMEARDRLKKKIKHS